MKFCPDEVWMERAIDLAVTGHGLTWPNPSVGTILVKDNVMVAAARTAKGGRPHAETEALFKAGPAAKGATLYVTLEPCAHYGQTPPCVEAIIAAGVSHVFVGVRDPDPRVNGKGIQRLQESGITVTEGVLRDKAVACHEAFFMRVQQNRPFFTLKMGISADNKIAAAPGVRTEITGAAAKEYTHYLRAHSDAIMVGVGTVLADDPLLTCRDKDYPNRNPLRIILDTHMRAPLTTQLMKSAKEIPTWIITSPVPLVGATDYEKAGARILPCQIGTDGRIDRQAMASMLAREGLTKIMVEGGQGVATALLREGLIDEVHLIKNQRSLGQGAIPMLATDNDFIEFSRKYHVIKSAPIEGSQDLLSIYRSKDLKC
jgi:diaminohydroxyphosphoribosylaminopyrimidine deaminase / 5-amino-6-(5-phosphoribosylamino)uracil reductase